MKLPYSLTERLLACLLPYSAFDMFAGEAGNGEWQDGVHRPGQRQQVLYCTQVSAGGEFSYGSTAVFRGNGTSPISSVCTVTEHLLARSLICFVHSLADVS